uniref:Uncharacterized protein n=1 Tax=Leersia perrieri TaxID=77586 RepID=A0A0D9XJN4_9ORYZ
MKRQRGGFAEERRGGRLTSVSSSHRIERVRFLKRCAGLARCSKNESTSLVEGDLNWYINQGVWSDLGEQNASKLSKSVVSIALSDGKTVLFSSSGIAIERGVNHAKFLTSASLVRALNDNESKNNDCQIEVCHGGKVVTGFLEEYDLYLGIALVKITSFLSVEAVFRYHWYEFMPYCNVVSLGRDISGKLMAVTGKLTPDSSGSEEHLMFSSCKLSEVWEGGPLFDLSGCFVGMNLVPSMEKSFFLPVNLIVERLQHFKTSQERTAFLARVKDLKTVRFRGLTDIPDLQPEGAPSKDHHWYLDALGYPRPTDRDKRFFACSGIFIDWDGKCPDNEYQTILTSACLVRNPNYPRDDGNKIVEGLRIEVLLPRNKQREGTLIHYNVHYNVAIVRVKESHGVSHAICKRGSIEMKSKLVASVGRCFKSGGLMASSGKLAHMIAKRFSTLHVEFRRTDVEIDSFRIDGDYSVRLNEQ